MLGSTGRTAMVRCLLVLLLACSAQSVRADDLADRLRSAWEVLWDERGPPQRAPSRPAYFLR